MKNIISIIDYEWKYIQHSICIEICWYRVLITDNEKIMNFKAIILPGVGALQSNGKN